MTLIIHIPFQAQTQTNTVAFERFLSVGDQNGPDFTQTELSAQAHFNLGFSTMFLATSLGITESSNFTFYPEIGINDDALKKVYHVVNKPSFRFDISKNWHFTTQFISQLSATLTHNLVRDDFFLGGGLRIGYSWSTENGTKPSSLVIGTHYDIRTGKPEWLPYLAYRHQLSKQWHVLLGYPETAIDFRTGRYHIQLKAEHQGSYSNISDPFEVNGRWAEKILSSQINTTLGLGYALGPHWSAQLTLGFAVDPIYQLADHSNQIVFDYNIDPRPTWAMGLKYRFNKTKTTAK
ncbi:hypothetical protein B7P33_18625 [Sediminicola luteus]|uniref:Uncharacterized protein n=2 Tax=Sediminicola luteus TaxID=319238 RepID=A0A2A4G0Y4_9FLAO|nr:hypothetical protein B7P33_18625 [Sediminicola luteus]